MAEHVSPCACFEWLNLPLAFSPDSRFDVPPWCNRMLLSLACAVLVNNSHLYGANKILSIPNLFKLLILNNLNIGTALDS